MIEFIEDTRANYQHRTWENARLSDVTIAFAVDFETSGELCTKKAALEYKKSFIPVLLNGNLNSYQDTLENIKYFLRILKIGKDGLCINIAGNGIGRLLKQGITQDQCDKFVYDFLKSLVDSGIKIKSIRSGGQTGADESGLKAALKLGIPGICLCPLGWRFRNESGDISDEVLFKKRFES